MKINMRTNVSLFMIVTTLVLSLLIGLVFYNDFVNYNADASRPQTIESLGADPELMSLSIDDEEANEVENADSEYQEVTPDSGDAAVVAPSAGSDAVIGC